MLLSIGGLCRYVIQEEIGESGTPHLQGVMSFVNAKKWSTLRGHAMIYWAKCNNVMAAKNYCSKIESASGQIWAKGFSVKSRKCRDPLEGKTLYIWQKDILDMVAGIPDDRSIYWYWSDKGSIGKTVLAKHMCLKYDAVVVGGKYKDAFYCIAERLNNDRDIDIVLFNLPRSVGNHVSYSAMEGIKDGMFFSPKYESKQVLYDPPHVLIFANVPPDMCMLSADRWKVKCLD